MLRPLLVSLALAVGGCRPPGPPAAPEDEQQRRAQAESERRAALAGRAEAEAEAQRAAEVQRAAIPELRAREDVAAEAERYAQVIAEAGATARECGADVERLVALHAYLIRYAAEPRRDAAIAALEPCRELAAKVRKRDPRLAGPWVPAPTTGRATPPELAPGGDLERLRGEVAEAEAQQRDAETALARAEADVAAADETLQSLDLEQQAREDAWRARMYESVRPMWIAGGVLLMGTAASMLAGLLLLDARDAITSGEREFATPMARDEALARNNRAIVAFLSVAGILAVPGITLFVVGKRRWIASGRLSLAPGGLTLRF